jgi:hypothetical protein
LIISISLTMFHPFKKLFLKLIRLNRFFAERAAWRKVNIFSYALKMEKVATYIIECYTHTASCRDRFRFHHWFTSSIFCILWQVLRHTIFRDFSSVCTKRRSYTPREPQWLYKSK